MRLIQQGNTASANVLVVGGTEILFSYETPVAAYSEKLGHVKTSTKYSATTSRHIKVWERSHYGVVAREVGQSFIDNIIQEPMLWTP